VKLSVFGAGSWGTAMAHHLARRGHETLVWAREAEVADGINAEHRNPLFLSDLDLHPELRAVDDLGAAAGHAEVWLWVVPVQFSRAVMQELRPFFSDDIVMVSASKGIETGTLRRMDEVAHEVFGIGRLRFCCLSGPTFAREVVRGDPSATVIACPDLELATRLQEEFADHHLRCYAGADLVGVELAGALKNVIAIAAGIIDGLGLGFNTQAALMTRGLHEITRLGVALGAEAETFRGLAGMGDLVLTCTGGSPATVPSANGSAVASRCRRFSTPCGRSSRACARRRRPRGWRATTASRCRSPRPSPACSAARPTPRPCSGSS
jgi:glycerol-3-phosphate dehydrogenase (NAD(P)+)